MVPFVGPLSLIGRYGSHPPTRTPDGHCSPRRDHDRSDASSRLRTTSFPEWSSFVWRSTPFVSGDTNIVCLVSEWPHEVLSPVLSHSRKEMEGGTEVLRLCLFWRVNLSDPLCPKDFSDCVIDVWGYPVVKGMTGLTRDVCTFVNGVEGRFRGGSFLPWALYTQKISSNTPYLI